MNPVLEAILPVNVKIVSRSTIEPVICCRCGKETHPRDLVWAEATSMAYDVCRNCRADLIIAARTKELTRSGLEAAKLTL